MIGRIYLGDDNIIRKIIDDKDIILGPTCAKDNIVVSQWYEMHIFALKRIFGLVQYDSDQFQWFHIQHFKLPEFYHPKTTHLFVRTPGEHINNHEGYSFYIDKGLTRPDMPSFEHIFEDESYNDLSHLGLARLSLHLKSFQPSYFSDKGDTLLDVIQNVYNFLALRKGL